MTASELSQAKDQDLKGSLTALRRAARMAREQALRTDTAIVVIQDNRLVRISAEELRKQTVL